MNLNNMEHFKSSIVDSLAAGVDSGSSSLISSITKRSVGEFEEVVEDSCGNADTDGKRRRIKKAKVDHTYRDFSNTSLEEVSVQLNADAATDASDNKEKEEEGSEPRLNKSISFPRKLYEMLTNPEFQHIICFVSIMVPIMSYIYGLHV